MFQVLTSVQEYPHYILGVFLVLLVLTVVNAFSKPSAFTSLFIGLGLALYYISFDVSRAYGTVSQSYVLPQKVVELKSENQKLRELNDQLIGQLKKDREEAALLVSSVKEFAKEALAQTAQQLRHNAEIKKVLDEAYSVLKNCKREN